jgi:hypothetical protein
VLDVDQFAGDVSLQFLDSSRPIWPNSARRLRRRIGSRRRPCDSRSVRETRGPGIAGFVTIFDNRCPMLVRSRHARRGLLLEQVAQRAPESGGDSCIP